MPRISGHSRSTLVHVMHVGFSMIRRVSPRRLCVVAR